MNTLNAQLGELGRPCSKAPRTASRRRSTREAYTLCQEHLLKFHFAQEKDSK